MQEHKAYINKDDKMVYLLYMLLLISDILYKKNDAFYYFFGGCMCVMAIHLFIIKRNKSLLISKKIEVHLMLIFFLTSIFSAFSNIDKIGAILKNTLILILFFYVVIELAIFMRTEEKMINFLKCTYVSMGLVEISCFILNYKSLNYIRQLEYLLNIYGRERWSFGLGHPNEAGLFSAICIIISIILLYKVKNEKNILIWRILVIFIDIVSLLIILGSSCRNAVFTLGLWFVVYFFFSFVKKKGKNKKNIYFFSIFSIFLTAIIFVKYLMNYYNSKNLYDLAMMSGRMIGMVAINYLIEQKKLLIGLGLSNKGDLLKLLYEKVIIVTDSSFFYYLVHLGLIGFIVVILLLFWVGIAIIKKKTKDKKYKCMIISTYIAFLFTGLFETTVLYAGAPIGLVCSVICIQFAYFGETD